jgi:hypothetical protein
MHISRICMNAHPESISNSLTGPNRNRQISKSHDNLILCISGWISSPTYLYPPANPGEHPDDFSLGFRAKI